MISVGLKSILWTAQAALLHMDHDRGGVIINNASPAAELGVTRSTVYSAIKGGVSSLTRSLAVEFGARKIRVNAVCPGTVPTPGAHAMITTTTPCLNPGARKLRLGDWELPENIAFHGHTFRAFRRRLP